MGSLLSTYLGLPLGVAFKSSQVWDVVEERFQKRLVEKIVFIEKREIDFN